LFFPKRTDFPIFSFIFFLRLYSFLEISF
jgi:hypothetical protein